jgi:hypothetical protein
LSSDCLRLPVPVHTVRTYKLNTRYSRMCVHIYSYIRTLLTLSLVCKTHHFFKNLKQNEFYDLLPLTRTASRCCCFFVLQLANEPHEWMRACLLVLLVHLLRWLMSSYGGCCGYTLVHIAGACYCIIWRQNRLPPVRILLEPVVRLAVVACSKMILFIFIFMAYLPVSILLIPAARRLQKGGQ